MKDNKADSAKIPSKDDQEKAGKLLARTLLDELSALESPAKETWTSSLLDEVPIRTSLAFTEKKKEARPKHDLRDSKNGDKKTYFLLQSLEYLSSENCDIDHVTPYAEMMTRQKALLVFLNANPNSTLVKSFLAYSDENAKRSMSDYIRLDEKDKQIKGTRYFYVSCYNELGNLMILPHGENIKKGKKSAVVCFGEHVAFGKSFLIAIKDSLFTGVIFQKVDQSSCKDSNAITLGNGYQYHAGLKSGNVLLLGEFARQWKKKGKKLVRLVREQLYDNVDAPLLKKLQDAQTQSLKIDDTAHNPFLNRLRKEIAFLSGFSPKNDEALSSDSESETSTEKRKVSSKIGFSIITKAFRKLRENGIDLPKDNPSSEIALTNLIAEDSETHKALLLKVKELEGANKVLREENKCLKAGNVGLTSVSGKRAREDEKTHSKKNGAAFFVLPESDHPKRKKVTGVSPEPGASIPMKI